MELQALYAIMPQEVLFHEGNVDDSRRAKLVDALLANVKLRHEGERLIAAYIGPESDRLAILDDLIRLSDGPMQREAELLSREVLADSEKWQYR